ncbi:hypothetical protein [Halobellus sp. EA9]|uniref:hypothetical protein n=1 Tax=Halobellus sp. EA9 TaxID=3421647 RepID=UPI003EBF7D92
MTDRTRELIDEYDLEPELIEGLLWRFEADLPVPDPEALEDTHVQVYEFLGEDDEPLRSAADHFYQFESHDEYGVRSDAPATEPDFEMVLDELVDAGLIARTDDRRPRYSASFHQVLRELGPEFTRREIDRLCAETGMDKRAVYRAIIDSHDLTLDLGR